MSRVTKDNVEKEHICCAISNNKDVQVSSMKAWLFSLMCFLRIQEPRDAMRVLDLPKGIILLTHSSIKTSLGADVI